MEKWQQINLENHNLIERLDVKNRGLRETIASLTKELSASQESTKASEGQIADLKGIVKTLRKELYSAQE